MTQEQIFRRSLPADYPEDLADALCTLLRLGLATWDPATDLITITERGELYVAEPEGHA